MGQIYDIDLCSLFRIEIGGRRIEARMAEWRGLKGWVLGEGVANPFPLARRSGERCKLPSGAAVDFEGFGTTQNAS